MKTEIKKRMSKKMLSKNKETKSLVCTLQKFSQKVK